jgi:thiosulfate dehydrogenase
MSKEDQYNFNRLLAIVFVSLFSVVSLLIFMILFIFNFDLMNLFSENEDDKKQRVSIEEALLKNKVYDSLWKAPAMLVESDDSIYLVKLQYGKELISHTAKYLGPRGSVWPMTNGMNCQNCHLEAGTKPYGNNYGAVKATYPKFRARSGTEENIYKRVNDCIERSLNGNPLEEQSMEMQSIKTYIEYIGSNVTDKKPPMGSGVFKLPVLKRAIDSTKGKVVYIEKCASCHQANGEGQLNPDGIEYLYPPLWGKHSYNVGAGLYRASMFAGYVKYNMPHGANFLNPKLTDEEAWDVSAFVNSQPRPTKDLSKDWPKISEKPFDHPFGPYTDGFTEEQHKYGPFGPIKKAKEVKK